MTQLRVNEVETFLNPSRIIAAVGVRDGMCVADFGCGSGAFSLASARAVGNHGEVWAIDVDRPMLSRLASMANAENVETQMRVLPGDVAEYNGSGLPDVFVDVVIAANILFGVHDIGMLAKEITRILKDAPDGALGTAGRVAIIDWEDSFDGAGPPEECIVKKDEVRALFERAGFDFLQDLPAGSHHWGILMRKN